MQLRLVQQLEFHFQIEFYAPCLREHPQRELLKDAGENSTTPQGLPFQMKIMRVKMKIASGVDETT